MSTSLIFYFLLVNSHSSSIKLRFKFSILYVSSSFQSFDQILFFRHSFDNSCLFQRSLTYYLFSLLLSVLICVLFIFFSHSLSFSLFIFFSHSLSFSLFIFFSLSLSFTVCLSFFFFHIFFSYPSFTFRLSFVLISFLPFFSLLFPFLFISFFRQSSRHVEYGNSSLCSLVRLLPL